MFPPIEQPSMTPGVDLPTIPNPAFPEQPTPDLDELLQLPDAPEEKKPPQPSLRQALVTLPMTKDEFQQWKQRIEVSQSQIKAREDEWDALWEQYLPNISRSTAQLPTYQGHFRNVHTKAGLLWVRNPDVTLSSKSRAKETVTQPQPPGPDGLPQPPKTLSAEDALAIRQAVINAQMEELGAMDLMDQCLLDMQAYSGFSAVYVDYRSVSRTVQRPVMQPGPAPMPDQMGMMPPQPPPQQPMIDVYGQPVTQPVQVPIHECWSANHIASKKLLLDERLSSTRYDKDSRWIGRIFFMPRRMAQRLYGLTDEEVESAIATDDRLFQDSAAQSSQSDEKDLLKGYHCWCKAEYFTDEDNPDAICELVIFDGVPDKPVVWRPSLHQTFDESGRLTEDSLEGFPIIVGSLRPAMDSPFPKADSAFADGDVKHITTHRQQMVMIRDAAIGKVLLDAGVFDEKDRDALINGTAGHILMLKPGMLAQGADKVMGLTAQVHSTPDDWRTAALLKADMDETLGISTPQTGGQTDTVRSATEINTMNQGSAGRAAKEQDRVLRFYLAIVRAVDTLVFRYATGNRYVEIAGETGARRLEMWNKKIGAGKFSYDIKPDSQLNMDAARDRQQTIGYYNVVAPDPLTNRAPILKRLASKFGVDAAEVVLDQSAVNAAQAASDMSGAPIGQPPAGGGPVNKHQAERSGGTQNRPGAPGDNRQERNPRGPGSPA